MDSDVFLGCVRTQTITQLIIFYFLALSQILTHFVAIKKISKSFGTDLIASLLVVVVFSRNALKERTGSVLCR